MQEWTPNEYVSDEYVLPSVLLEVVVRWPWCAGWVLAFALTGCSAAPIANDPVVAPEDQGIVMPPEASRPLPIMFGVGIALAGQPLPESELVTDSGNIDIDVTVQMSFYEPPACEVCDFQGEFRVTVFGGSDIYEAAPSRVTYDDIDSGLSTRTTIEDVEIPPGVSCLFAVISLRDTSTRAPDAPTHGTVDTASVVRTAGDGSRCLDGWIDNLPRREPVATAPGTEDQCDRAMWLNNSLYVDAARQQVGAGRAVIEFVECETVRPVLVFRDGRFDQSLSFRTTAADSETSQLQYYLLDPPGEGHYDLLTVALSHFPDEPAAFSVKSGGFRRFLWTEDE